MSEQMSGSTTTHRRSAKSAALWLALGAALVCFVHGGAANAQQDSRVPVDQATTQQKAIFLQNLVTKSVAVETIEGSGDAQSLAKLEQARELVREAQSVLQQGDYATANAKLNDALALINTETRKLSEQDIKQTRREESYDKRMNTVQTFLKAYERVAGEKEISAAAAAQMGKVRQLVEQAETLAGAGQVDEANEVLERAYETARGDIREIREGQTLTRSLNFETPEEEFRYEKDRNDSHVMLLRFALSEKQPPEAFVQRIEALREEATDLRSLAEKQAASGGHPQAIQTLVKSTETLLKAIRMSGIYIPG